MRDPPGPPSLGEDSIVEGCPTGLCQICDRLRGIPDHSGSLQRMRPSQGSLATANSYAHLHGLWSRTENPGVGGSIPSQPTIVFSPAGNDLARAARSRRARCARLTRTVLELTRLFRVAVVTASPTRAAH